MKTLEERLMDAGERFSHETDPTGSLWVALHDALAIVAEYHSESTEITGTYPDLVGGSISSAPGTFSFGSENLQSYKECEVCGGKRYWVNTLDAFVPCTFCDPTNSPSEE